VPVEARLYPINLILTDQSCLVVGGGSVAARKAAGLLECGARVHVIATEVGADVRALAVPFEERPYSRGDVAGYRLVLAATDDPVTNRMVFEDAEEGGIWMNSADDPASSTFTLPSVVRRGPIMLTVSTGGYSPALATWLKGRFEREVGPEYEILVELLSSARNDLKAAGVATEQADWQRLLDSDMLDLVKAGQIDQARERLRAWLSSSLG
jgi:precorrin-2 dehydrogenase/sirohydrochlorin ferrochelatase